MLVLNYVCYDVLDVNTLLQQAIALDASTRTGRPCIFSKIYFFGQFCIGRLYKTKMPGRRLYVNIWTFVLNCSAATCETVPHWSEGN